MDGIAKRRIYVPPTKDREGYWRNDPRRRRFVAGRPRPIVPGPSTDPVDSDRRVPLSRKAFKRLAENRPQTLRISLNGHDGDVVDALDELGIDTSVLDSVEPKSPHESQFAYTNRLLNALPPEVKHEVTKIVRERPEPLGFMRDAANTYRVDNGIPIPKVEFSSLTASLDKAKLIKAAVDADDGVKTERARKAYDEFKQQTEEMWSLLTGPPPRGLGVTVEPWDERVTGEVDPYSTAEDQRHDVEANHHLWINRGGFFIGDHLDTPTGTNHPFMTEDEYFRFRAIHDAFGHVAAGTGFDRHGEYGAWAAHNSMYRGEGRRAMSTEYHAVNSYLWVTGGTPMPAKHLGMLLPDELNENIYDYEGNVVRKGWDTGIMMLIDALEITPAQASALDNQMLTGLVHANGGTWVSTIEKKRIYVPPTKDRRGYWRNDPRTKKAKRRYVSDIARGGHHILDAASFRQENILRVKGGKAESRDKYRVSGHYTPERMKVHNAIVDGWFDGKTPVANPTFTFLGGGPASGKSSVALKQLDLFNQVVIAPDEAKEALPEYKALRGLDDRSASAWTHEESSDIGSEAIARALAGGYNVVYDGVGDTTVEKMQEKINRARNEGYTVNGLYVTVPTEVAVERAKAREKVEWRNVPETVLRKKHADVSRIIPELWPDFDSFDLYDTSSSDGPIYVASGGRGRDLVILDQARWDEFVAKAMETVVKDFVIERIADDGLPTSEDVVAMARDYLNGVVKTYPVAWLPVFEQLVHEIDSVPSGTVVDLPFEVPEASGFSKAWSPQARAAALLARRRKRYMTRRDEKAKSMSMVDRREYLDSHMTRQERKDRKALDSATRKQTRDEIHSWYEQSRRDREADRKKRYVITKDWSDAARRAALEARRRRSHFQFARPGRMSPDLAVHGEQWAPVRTGSTGINVATGFKRMTPRVKNFRVGRRMQEDFNPTDPASREERYRREERFRMSPAERRRYRKMKEYIGEDAAMMAIFESRKKPRKHIGITPAIKPYRHRRAVPGIRVPAMNREMAYAKSISASAVGYLPPRRLALIATGERDA